MSVYPRFSRVAILLALVGLILGSIACGIPSLSVPTPTATLPVEVDSTLRTKLIGQWQIVNGGPWGDATLTFNEDGSFTVIGGSHAKDDKGSFFFISEDTIMFFFQDYQGSAYINFLKDNEISLAVTPSNEPFGAIYTAERVE